MRFLDTLQQKIGFTRHEAIALLTFSVVILGGVGIRTFTPRPEVKSVPRFDYSKSDSAYSAARRESLRTNPQHLTPDVPSKHISDAGSGKKQVLSLNPININTAAKSQLMTLPGIGPSYADRIIAYRAANGGFRTVDELSKIKGIGEKKLEKLRPFVRLR
jgi:competence protein ComEA